MKNMDHEEVILRYKHNPNKRAFIFIFVISNGLIPLIIVLTNDASNSSSAISSIFTPPSDGFSKFSYYCFVILFIYFNSVNFISLYAQVRGWSELKRSSDGSVWIYSQYKKKNILLAKENLVKLELSRSENDSDWILFAKYIDQSAVKIISGRQIPNEIAPDLAKKMNIELQIIDAHLQDNEGKNMIDGEILILAFFGLVILIGIILVFFILYD